MIILLAGGAGYIGSHTAVQLLNEGHEVIIIDNYTNSAPEAINRIEKITGKKVLAYDADIKDQKAVELVFYQNKIDCVIHFAGLKAVGESVEHSLVYYRKNIDMTLTLLECKRGNSSGIYRMALCSFRRNCCSFLGKV